MSGASPCNGICDCAPMTRMLAVLLRQAIHVIDDSMTAAQLQKLMAAEAQDTLYFSDRGIQIDRRSAFICAYLGTHQLRRTRSRQLSSQMPNKPKARISAGRQCKADAGVS